MQFFLFGKFSFHDESGPDRLLALQHSPRLQELLAYLLVYANRPVSRGTLVRDLRWEQLAIPADAALHNTLNRLQVLLGEDALLQDDERCIQWNPQMELWVDVCQFKFAVRQAVSCLNQPLDHRATRRLHAVVDLYRGPFLDGCYSPWCLEIRSRLEQDCLQLLEILMDANEAQGDYDAGLLLGLRALRLEHSREGAHRRMMRLLYLSGDRTAALRQYRRCAESIAEDLQARPDEETEALHRQIQAGFPLQSAPSASILLSFPHVLVNLRSLQQSLSHLMENV